MPPAHPGGPCRRADGDLRLRLVATLWRGPVGRCLQRPPTLRTLTLIALGALPLRARLLTATGTLALTGPGGLPLLGALLRAGGLRSRPVAALRLPRIGRALCPSRIAFSIFFFFQGSDPGETDLISCLSFYIIASDAASHGISRVSLAEPPIPPAQTPRARARRRFAAPRTIFALMLREMSTRYGRTPGGYLWAVAEPLGMIVILAIAFSLLVRTPSLGESFILFYATGYLPFHLFQVLSNQILRAMLFSRPLLNYPVVTWMDTILARFALNTLTSVLVAYVMLAVILALTDTRAVLDMGPILGGFGLAMMLGLGFGALNCALTGLFPVWQQLWSIVTRPLFIASAVIFILEDLPASAQDLLWWNPLVHVTGLVRTGFYATYAPNYISVLYTMGVALVAMLAGFLLLRRFHRDILSR